MQGVGGDRRRMESLLCDQSFHFGGEVHKAARAPTVPELHTKKLQRPYISLSIFDHTNTYFFNRKADLQNDMYIEINQYVKFQKPKSSRPCRKHGICIGAGASGNGVTQETNCKQENHSFYFPETEATTP